MSKIRRICVYGGPCSGKSTAAMQISSQLKIAGVNVEHVQEAVKRWVYEGRTISGFDQVLLMATQLNMEEIFLRSDAETVIVTESPLYQGLVYAKMYDTPAWKHLLPIVATFEETYPGLHLFVERGPEPYQEKGRYQTEQDARRIDSYTRLLLEETGTKFHSVPRSQLGRITQIVFNALEV